MKRRTKLAGVFFAAVLTMSVAPALAADRDADQDTVTARLSGFQETPLTISSPGSGEFIATIREGGCRDRACMQSYWQTQSFKQFVA
jgi:hypothetical protein